jgi:hypothetical protein
MSTLKINGIEIQSESDVKSVTINIDYSEVKVDDSTEGKSKNNNNSQGKSNQGGLFQQVY